METIVAVYLRVSTNNQSAGLEAQERAILKYCNENGYKNIKVYKDEGISGAKSSRPALDQMIKDAKQGLLESVIVYSFSRFARSTKHLIEALELFNQLKIDFVSLSEKLESKSPSGRAIFTILAAISQLERELISERVKNGLINAKAKGKTLGAIKRHTNYTLVNELKNQGMSMREISKLTKISPATISRMIKSSVSQLVA